MGRELRNSGQDLSCGWAFPPDTPLFHGAAPAQPRLGTAPGGPGDISLSPASSVRQALGLSGVLTAAAFPSLLAAAGLGGLAQPHQGCSRGRAQVGCARPRGARGKVRTSLKSQKNERFSQGSFDF